MIWIIGFAEGGFIGPFMSRERAERYRAFHLAGRVANIYPVEEPT